ncbi:MAG: hypothetical protein AAGI71_14095 [Bacteroidota bacterium]
MHRLLYLLLLLVLHPASGQAVEDPASYYPLQVGNVWQYRHIDWPDTALVEVRVVGDTLMADGYVYQTVETEAVVWPAGPEVPPALRLGSFKARFQRLDTTSALVYAHDSGRSYSTLWLAVTEPHAPHPDTTLDNRYPFRFDSLKQQTVFDQPHAVIRGQGGGGCDACEFRDLTLAQGLGVIHYKSTLLPHFAWQATLVYAQINGQTYGEPVATAALVRLEVPEALAVEAAYPNPFRDATQVPIRVREAGPVRVRALDVLGRQVTVLFDGLLPPGLHEVAWRPSRLPGGAYWLEVVQGAHVVRRSVLYVR